MSQSNTAEAMILGRFPLDAFRYKLNGPFISLLRSPQFIIIEFLYDVKGFYFFLGTIFSK